VILVGAFAVRCVGVTWGFPYVYHADEPSNYYGIHHMLLERSLNPRSFQYPSLFFDVQAAAHTALYWFGHAAGWWSAPRYMPAPRLVAYADGRMPDWSPFFVGRMVTVILGVAIVAVGMLLARRLTQYRAAIVVAGVLLAIHPVLVENARFVTPDTLGGLTATLAVLGAVAVERNPRLRNYVLTGVAIGLAGSSKYNIAVVGVALVVAHFLARPEHNARAWNLVVAAGVAIAAFLLTTPYSVLDAHRFWDGFSSVLGHYSRGQVGAQGGSFQTNLRWLWGSTGPLLIAVIGTWWTPPSVRRRLLVPLSFVIVYFVLVSTPIVRFERNLVPVLPSLLVVVAVVIVELVNRWTMSPSATTWRIATRGAVVLLLCWPAVLAVRDARASLRDDRARAREWVARNMPAHSEIVLDAYSPWVDPKRYRVRGDTTPLNFGAMLSPAPDADAVVVTQLGFGRYLSGGSRDNREVAIFEQLQHDACATATFGQSASRIWVFRLHCPTA
jgi:hypothetical protein